ncbi:MAG TPA: O-antigen ligase family protein [Planctomycetota bacterium]
MPPRVRALWISFLVVWAAALFVFGAVKPWAIAATSLAMAALYGTSLILLPDPPRMSKAGLWFLAGFAGILLLQALPLPFLYPYTTRLRETHGVGTLWPGTADTFLSVRFTAQAAAYVLAALLVIRLRQAGLSTSSAIRGLLLVAGLEAAWGVVRALGGIDWIPFYDGPRTGGASGTLVNRNNFGGLCAMGLVLASALSTARFSWPPRREDEASRPSLGRRAEAGLGWALLAALFSAAILLSHSRGAALAAIAGLVVLPFLHRGRASLAGLAAVLAAGTVAFVASNPSGMLDRFGAMDPFALSGEQRWRIWELTTSAAGSQPLLGFGVGTHPHAFHPFQPATLPGQVQHAHNEYVNVLFEAGVVGLLFTLAVLGIWISRAWRGLRPLHSPDRLPAAGLVAAALAILAHSLIDFDLRITGVGLMWAALVGLGAALSRGGEPVRATPWVVTGASLAAGLLLFTPLKTLALSPYDHALAVGAGNMETAAALFPAHPALQRQAGLGFWDEGALEKSAACFRRLFAQRPEEVEPVLEVIYDPARPVAAYETLLPGTSETAARLASFLAKQGEWAKGMEVFERGVSKGPEGAASHDYLATTLRGLGQWGLEARVRDRRLDAKSDAWAFGAAGEAWHRLGIHDRALERAVTAERIDPSNGSWTALKAEILAMKGDELGAMEALTEALRKSPADLNHRLRRAELALSGRTYRLAAEDFREVLRSRPGERRAALGLARALIGLDQRDSAKLLLDEWLGKHPEDGEAIDLRGRSR